MERKRGKGISFIVFILIFVLVPIVWAQQEPSSSASKSTNSLNERIPNPVVKNIGPDKAASPNILVYTDAYLQYLVEPALTELGLSATIYYDDYTGFGAALTTGGPWDLVIVDHNNYYDLGYYWSEIEDYFNSGGKVIITTFDIDGSDSESTTLWNTLGLSYISDKFSLENVYRWDTGHPVFNTPESIGDLTSWTDGYLDKGDHVSPTAGVSAVAGFASSYTANSSGIIVRNDNRAIVNSFIIDESNIYGKELWKNEISYLLGEAKWTFMVYLDGDNNLESAGIDDFLEMSSVGSNANVNIVVMFDRISGYNSSYGDWTGTKYFYVTKNLTPDAANAVSDLGELNMGDPANLVNFVTWAKSNYPASNYALILWNHGGGWRDEGEDKGKRDERKKPRDKYRAVCWDDTDGGDCLYMSEVKSALSTQGAQLVGFDACLMGMVEVAYNIKDYAQVMVGSEETEPGDGWPYNTILSNLAANPSWTAAQLGSAIVDRYYESYGNDETQSAIDLSNMSTLASTISTFAQSMMNNWDSDVAAVKAAAQNVNTAINNTVINEKHGAGWPGAHGLAIYYPGTSGAFDSNYNGTIIDFPLDTQWEEFLADFYSTMGGSWIEDARNESQEFTYTEYIDLFDFCDNIINSTGDNWIVVLSEGFENGSVPPSGWSLESQNTNYTWQLANYNPHSGAYYTNCLYDPSLVPQDEVLISSQISGLSSAKLELWSKGSIYWGISPYNNYDVEVWLVFGAWGGGDDIYLGLADDDWSGTWQWSKSSYDLSSYLSGQPFRVAFRYIGTDGAEGAVDDIEILTPKQDVNVGLLVFHGNDFTGNNKADIAVYRPSNGYWYIKDGSYVRWGIQAGDIPVPGDYNGDGTTDIAVYRNSDGYWYIKGIGNYRWGIQPGDIPVPGDYNKDGKTDIAVYRPSDGYWYIRGVGNYRWGIQQGDVPVPGDYNGDNQTDIAVYRPSNGYWYIKGIGNYQWGIQSGDIPVPGDYDGNGTTDIAIYRHSNGYWYIRGGSYVRWGIQSEDIPVQADYNGDGNFEIAVYRPSNGYWYIKGVGNYQWGIQQGDIPVTRGVK